MKSDSGNWGAEIFCAGMKSGESEMLGEEFEIFSIVAEAFRGISVAAFRM